MKNTAIQFVTALSLMLAVAVSTSSIVAYGDLTPGEKASEVKDDAVKNAKQAGRGIKRAGRNAVGRGSVVKDAKDKAADVGDEVKDKADDVKKKVD